MTAKMTPKQKAFVAEFLVDLNQTQAAIRAGCAVKSAPYTARRWIKLPDVKEAIDKAMENRAVRTEITADMVLKGILRNSLKAESKGDHSAATRALELLGRHLRLFTDKVELTGQNGAPVEFTEIRRTVIDPRQL